MARIRDRLTRKRHDAISLQAMEQASLRVMRYGGLIIRYKDLPKDLGSDGHLGGFFFEEDYELMGLVDELEILTFMRVYTQHGEQLMRGTSEKLQVSYHPRHNGGFQVYNDLVIEKTTPQPFIVSGASITEAPLPETVVVVVDDPLAPVSTQQREDAQKWMEKVLTTRETPGVKGLKGAAAKVKALPRQAMCDCRMPKGNHTNGCNLMRQEGRIS